MDSQNPICSENTKSCFKKNTVKHERGIRLFRFGLNSFAFEFRQFFQKGHCLEQYIFTMSIKLMFMF